MRHLFAILLLVLAVPANAQSITATPDLPQAGSAAVDVGAVVEEYFSKTLSLLESDFPADHRALMTRIAAIEAAADTERELMVLVAQEFTALRRKYADRLLFAPTLAHQQMLSRLAVFYDRVHQAEGPEVCGRFAADGSAVLFDLGLSRAYMPLIDGQSLAYFEAVVGAIEAPEYSGAATGEDWNVVIGRMIEAGAPPSFAATIAGGNPGDPNLCPALAAMFITTALLDMPEGARTRADFARNLTGY